MIDVLPPNLAELGIQRKHPISAADLETIWRIPDYPVITQYLRLCDQLGWEPFGGGTRQIQGSHSQPGFITSGYRDAIINGNKHSAHRYALALDIHVGNAQAQIAAAHKAVNYFNRVGLYPDGSFIHVDLMPFTWVEIYRRKRFWVTGASKTVFSSNDLRAAISHVEQRMAKG